MAIINGAIDPTAGGTTPPVTAAPALAPGTVAQLGGPTQWNVTPDQTVEGRIKQIISANNPIIQMARTQGAEQANARGLLNSSMGVQAGEAAAFGAATPIATADAATAAKAASFNADTSNQFATTNANAQNTQAGQQLAATTQTGIAQLGSQTQLQIAGQQTQAQRDIAGLNAQTQTQIAGLNADTQTKVAQLNAETQKTIQQLQAQNQTLLQTNGQAANAMNQALVSMTNINMSTTMDANAKTQAVQQVRDALAGQLKVLSAVSGLNLTSQLDFSGLDLGGGAGSAQPGLQPVPVASPQFVQQVPGPENGGNSNSSAGGA